MFDDEETPLITTPLEQLGEQNPIEKIGQEQIHSLLFSEKLSWQQIIYDLINTEQLDPWDIDLTILANKYLERVKQIEEANFFISSKVLLAASLLLRIKSEILLEQDIQSLDDILFGKKEQKKYIQERIELDEDIPGLIPRTPLPRFRKVTMQELMSALGKAIKTETRRIKRVVLTRQQEMETAAALPKHRINVQESIRIVYQKLKEIFKDREDKIAFSDFAGKTTEEKVATFIPLLYLDSQQKVWVEQEAHLEEIWIWLKEIYESKNKEKLEEMRLEVEAALKEIEEEEKAEALKAQLEEKESKKFKKKRKKELEEINPNNDIKESITDNEVSEDDISDDNDNDEPEDLREDVFARKRSSQNKPRVSSHDNIDIDADLEN